MAACADGRVLKNSSTDAGIWNSTSSAVYEATGLNDVRPGAFIRVPVTSIRNVCPTQPSGQRPGLPAQKACGTAAPTMKPTLRACVTASDSFLRFIFIMAP